MRALYSRGAAEAVDRFGQRGRRWWASLALREFRRVLRRRDIVSLCIFIFMADSLSGIVIPTFSIYAQGLGAIADRYDIAASYGFAAALALVGFIFGYLFLPRYDAHTVDGASNDDDRSSNSRPVFMSVFLYPLLLIASVAVFLGAIQNFFPLYGQDAAVISAGFIATMFSIRAFASTGVRLPMGLLSAKITTAGVIALSLFLMGVSLVGISLSTDTMFLTIFLAMEGIGFGGFVTAGQAFTAEVSTGQTRCIAMGIYRMAGALRSAGGPIIMGYVASQWSFALVFLSTGVCVVAGAVAVGWTVPWRRVFTRRLAL